MATKNRKCPSPDCSGILFWRGTKPEKIERKAGKASETKKSRTNRDFFLCVNILFQFFLHRNFLECFDGIVHFNVVVVLDLDSAIVTFRHFFHIVFETFQRS